MSSEQPYNSLGQILSTGGEIALGTAISLGRSSGALAALFIRRFEPMLPNDRDELWRIAREGSALYRDLPGMDPDDLVPLDLTPLNPFLFGGGTEGRRVLAVGESSLDNGISWYQRRLILPDQPTWSELTEELAKIAYELLDKYPRGFKSVQFEPGIQALGRLLFMERAF